jgi:hypothetical protein
MAIACIAGFSIKFLSAAKKQITAGFLCNSNTNFLHKSKKTVYLLEFQQAK